MLNSEIIYFDELDSTNTEMKRFMNKGAESGLVIRAGVQTGGKGRLGKSWESPRDEGVYMSVLLVPDKKKIISAPISLVTGLGVRNTVEYYTHTDIMLKWPNDVLSGCRKVSGILVEASVSRDGIGYFIIGIGVNVNTEMFPAELDGKATSFYMETGKRFDVGEVANRIVSELDMLYTELFEGKPVMDGYAAHCVNIGTVVRLIYNGNETEGIAKSIGSKGELLVETYQGEIIAAHSGEVSIRGIDGYV